MTLDLAERALGHVREADSALVSVATERSLLLRFARSHPTQATSVEDATISVTVVRDGHVGGAATNRDDDESLAACARSAEAAAEAAARTRGSGSYPGFPQPGDVKAADGFDEATAEMDPAVGGAALATAFEIAARHGVEAHGVWSTGDVETALVSSTGVALTERVTDAFMKTTCIADSGRSGWANQAGVAVGELNSAQLAEAAATRATGAFAPRTEVARLEPGEYPVVLAGAAVGEMLDWLGLCAFNGLAHAEKRGALNGQLGSPLAAPAVNPSHPPRHPPAPPPAVDP